jgi:hypothetical protein
MSGRVSGAAELLKHRHCPERCGDRPCLATGDRWVNVRRCLTYGLVGCCDGSPDSLVAFVPPSGHERRVRLGGVFPREVSRIENGELARGQPLGEEPLVNAEFGHLHVIVDDLPWWWADASDNNTVDIANIPPGQHKVRIELVDADHNVFPGQTSTLTFTIPKRAAQSH